MDKALNDNNILESVESFESMVLGDIEDPPVCESKEESVSLNAN